MMTSLRVGMLPRSLSAALGFAVFFSWSAIALAENLRIIDKDTSYVVNGPKGKVTITRVKTDCAPNKGWLQPMVPVPGVTAIGEIEVLNALNDPNILVLDMREVEWFVKSTIPTAVNIPYTEVASRLNELGCKKGGDKKWDCSGAKTVLAFCNGPVCPQSPTAIKAMKREGFPMDKVLYYRGGMLNWKALGFTTVAGEL